MQFQIIIGTLAFAGVLQAATLYTQAGGGSARSGEINNGSSSVGTDSAVFIGPASDATAHASYGRLSVDAYSNCVFRFGLYCNSSASATAEFKDALTIFDHSGYVEAQVYFNGTNIDGLSYGEISLGTQGGTWFLSRPPRLTPEVYRSVFTDGTPLMLFASLTAYACQDGGYRCPSGSSDGRAAANFVQFQIFDLDNNRIGNVTYATDSHVSYNVVGGTNVSNPEPGTLLTAAGALLLVLVIRRFAQS